MSLAETPVTAATLPALEPEAVVSRERRRWGRHVLAYLLTAFVLVSLNFFLPRALPGDPVAALAGGGGAGRGSVELSEADRAKLSRYYGLDRPLLDQYGRYLGGLARGDLGDSIRYNVPVWRLLSGRLKWSLLLVGTAMTLATGLGMVAGIHSGWRRDRGLDRGLLGVLVGVGNFPVYVIASLALIAFGVKLRWFPIAGAQTPFTDYGFVRRAVDVAHHLVLPATVMALQFLFLLYLVMRGGMVSEAGSDHLLLGRVKGLRERRLKYRYAARNALLPVVTVVALDIGVAVGATVFVERAFAYPGLGRLMFESIDFRDYPTMQGCFLVIAMVVLTVNLATDLVYPRLDPTVRR